MTRAETITWATKNGETVTATVTLRRRTRHVGTNELTGKAMEREAGLIIETTAEVAGRIFHTLRTGRVGVNLPDGYTGAIGGADGLVAVPAEKVAEIEAAIERMKASDEWQEHEAARREHDAEMERVEAERRHIERVR